MPYQIPLKEKNMTIYGPVICNGKSGEEEGIILIGPPGNMIRGLEPIPGL